MNGQPLLGKIPLEEAIAIIEELSNTQSSFEWAQLRAQVRHDPDCAAMEQEMMWWLDRTLKIMLSHGLLRRLHLQPGALGYVVTGQWPKRNQVLSLLRIPRQRPKNRGARKRRRQEQAMEQRLQQKQATETAQVTHE